MTDERELEPGQPMPDEDPHTQLEPVPDVATDNPFEDEERKLEEEQG